MTPQDFAGNDPTGDRPCGWLLFSRALAAGLLLRLQFSILAFEAACHGRIRSSFFYWKTFLAGLVAMSLVAVVLPLIVSWSWSFVAASHECNNRAVAILAKFRMEGDDRGDINDFASRHLFPQHTFNTSSMLVTLFCFLVWYFYSPHNSDTDKKLDRALGAYFGTGLLANIIVAAVSLGSNCAVSPAIADPTFAIFLFVSAGVSVIGTNLLCHRYLLEKANAMVTHLGDPYDPAAAWLKKLEMSFQWELGCLGMVAFGVPMFFISPTLGSITLVVGGSVLFIVDLGFSYYVTMVFIRPILHVLKSRSVNGNEQQIRYDILLETKWTTLIGIVVALVSSTALYVNCIAFAVLGRLGEPFYANPFLNIFVFGINADSSFNDLGLLLSSGLFLAVINRTSESLATMAARMASKFHMRDEAAARKVCQAPPDERQAPPPPANSEDEGSSSVGSSTPSYVSSTPSLS